METLRTSWAAYRCRRTLFALMAFILLLQILVVILTSGAVHIPFGQIWREIITPENLRKLYGFELQRHSSGAGTLVFAG